MVGDLHIANGNTERLEQILTLAAAEGDEFVILLGDIVDKGDEASFLAVDSAIRNSSFGGKVLPLLGNHDIFSNGWQLFKEQWGASHYAVTVGNSRFLH
jgi:3',5'-cyclic AMP phosphodiesterase CpdA